MGQNKAKARQAATACRAAKADDRVDCVVMAIGGTEKPVITTWV